MINGKDVLIIGSGISGSVIARKLAQANKKVLILEKKDHIAGHIYDKKIEGIMSHMYGPHIFHTDKEDVIEFLKPFWELNGFKNNVLCDVQGKLIPIPFNFVGIDTFFPKNSEEIKKILVDKYKLNSRITITELLNDPDPQINNVAHFIYENIFANYTSKMWGVKAEDIDPNVLKRVPINIGYETTYFQNKYEGVPVEGYTETIRKILDHPNIEVVLNKSSQDVLTIKNNKLFFENKEINIPVFYSGPIDELFNYQFDVLDYRSLNIVFETIEKDSYQDSAVVNYPAHPTMTRISEQKKFSVNTDVKNKTVISKEYPGKFVLNDPIFHTPYYPLMTDNAKKSYQTYNDMAKKIPNLHLIGRLATFKYINMDDAVKIALEKVQEFLNEK